MVIGDTDFGEIIDPETYIPESTENFSRTQLVMRACMKCLESGSREMRAGYFNERADRNGNIIKTYIEDTRKAFIESVKTLKMFMIPDCSPEIKKIIKEFEESLDKRFKELCDNEFKDWSTSNYQIKQARWKQGIKYTKDTLNKEMQYYQEYIDEEVLVYRKIFEILIEITEDSEAYNEVSISA